MTCPMRIRFAVCAGVLAAVTCGASGLAVRAAEEKKAGTKKVEPKNSFGAGAEGVNTTSGRVVSVKGLAIEVKSDGGEVSFYANKTNKAVVALLGQLVASDSVTVTWVQKDGRKWIQKIEGRDTVEGTVTAKNNLGIVVKPDRGDPQQVLFPWSGAPPEEVAQLDQNVAKRLSRAKPGDKVRLTWQISDAKRAVDLKYLAKAPGQKSSPKATPQDSPHHSPSVNGLLRRARHMGGRVGGGSGAGGAVKP